MNIQVVLYASLTLDTAPLGKFFIGKTCLIVYLTAYSGWLLFSLQKLFLDLSCEAFDLMGFFLKIQVWEENCRGRGPLREEECPELNMVWLDCNGEDDPDKENVGSISYTPW